MSITSYSSTTLWALNLALFYHDKFPLSYILSVNLVNQISIYTTISLGENKKIQVQAKQQGKDKGERRQKKDNTRMMRELDLDLNIELGLDLGCLRLCL